MTGRRLTERERLESLKLNPIQIAFGDIFLSSEDGRTRYIIVDVGQGNTFDPPEYNIEPLLTILRKNSKQRPRMLG